MEELKVMFPNCEQISIGEMEPYGGSGGIAIAQRNGQDGDRIEIPWAVVPTLLNEIQQLLTNHETQS